jgi:hypothetical protein
LHLSISPEHVLNPRKGEFDMKMRHLRDGIRVFLFTMVVLVLAAGPLLAARGNALDRIDYAWTHHQISLAQAVMLKADILFNPGMIPDSSPFRPGPGERYSETDFSAFYENVYMARKQLSESQKAYLAALNPELKRVLAAAAAGQPPYPKKKPREYRPSAADRLFEAARQGKISRKEELMIYAQLCFAPQTVANPEFQVRPGEVAVSGERGMILGGMLDDVFNELTPGEKEYLKSLGPELKLMIEGKEKAAGQYPLNYPPLGTGPWGAWVDDICNKYSLDRYVEGNDCIVHYSLDKKNNLNAAPNPHYVNLVKEDMDKAIDGNMTADFRRAYHEGGGKLHVFLFDLGGDAGQCWKGSPVAGKAHSVYIYMDINIDPSGKEGQHELCGTAFHEYFHGIQNTYDTAYDDSSPNNNIWFWEASAVWAECYYGQNWINLESDYYDIPRSIDTGSIDMSGSIFNDTNQPLWKTQRREYSLSTLVFYLCEHHGDYTFVKSFFEEATEISNAMDDLQALLGASFGDDYKTFLKDLYTKNIQYIRDFMPDVQLAKEAYSQYGDNQNNSVYLTGAQYYVCNPETGNPGPALIVTFKKDEATGAQAEGVLMKDNNPDQKYPFDENNRTFFQKQDWSQVVLIATDVNYSGEDYNQRDYNYGVYLPYFHINQITVVNPVIYVGEISETDFNLDVLGLADPSSNPPFGLQVEARCSLPWIDGVSGIYMVKNGRGQVWPFGLVTYPGVAPGIYDFTFQFKVPNEDWAKMLQPVPQSADQGSFSVQVLPSAAVAPSWSPGYGTGSGPILKPWPMLKN